MAELEALMEALDAHVSFLLAPEGWSLEMARRILVPVAGGSEHGVLRARVLGSLCRNGDRSVTWLRVLPASASEAALREARGRLEELANDTTPGHGSVEVTPSDDALGALARWAKSADQMVVGLTRQRRRRSFGRLVPELVRAPICATLIISEGRR